MEVGFLTFTAVSSALPRPAAALVASHCRGTSTICQHNHQLSPIKTATSYSDTSQITSSSTSRSRGNLIVNAKNQTFYTRNWDVSNYAAPSWLPRFEELDTTNMLLRQRIIFLGTQIDDMTADFVISQLLLLDSEDQQKDIKLFINSPGGSVTAGMGIYDAMKLCKADVSTINMGLAASMGAFLLASGTKGKRFCMPNARVMIHQPLGTAGGKERELKFSTQFRFLDYRYPFVTEPFMATEMSIRIREMSYHKIKLNKILSRATGKPEQQIELDTDRDNFMNAWEAKEYGLVDEVIDDGKPGLVAPIADASPPPKTRVWGPWKIEGSRKGKKNLPSEENLLKNGYASGQGNDDDRGTEQKKEEPTPI